MNEILIIVAFLLGHEIGKYDRVIPAIVSDKVNGIKFFKQKTKVFQDGEIKEGPRGEEVLKIKDLEF